VVAPASPEHCCFTPRPPCTQLRLRPPPLCTTSPSFPGPICWFERLLPWRRQGGQVWRQYSHSWCPWWDSGGAMDAHPCPRICIPRAPSLLCGRRRGWTPSQGPRTGTRGPPAMWEGIRLRLGQRGDPVSPNQIPRADRETQFPPTDWKTQTLVVRMPTGPCPYCGPTRQCGSAAVGIAVLGSMVVSPRRPPPLPAIPSRRPHRL